MFTKNEIYLHILHEFPDFMDAYTERSERLFMIFGHTKNGDLRYMEESDDYDYASHMIDHLDKRENVYFVDNKRMRLWFSLFTNAQKLDLYVDVATKKIWANA